jgi:hypothetical protein
LLPRLAERTDSAGILSRFQSPSCTES